jgi:hypothetical protein
MLDQLFANPVAQFLGFESDLQYAREITLFLYTLYVLKHNKAGSNFVSTFILTYVRAFGAIGFALPLILGQLPGETLKQMDDYAVYVVAAQIYHSFHFPSFFPQQFNNLTGKLNGIAYYIVKGNVAAQGYAAAAGAIGGSQLAPYVGAYVAVQGARFIESGVGAVDSKTFNEDGLLAILSGPFIQYSGLYLDFTPFMARVTLVCLRWSCEAIAWPQILQEQVNKIGSVFTRAAKRASSPKGMKKRGRSRTPVRR